MIRLSESDIDTLKEAPLLLVETAVFCVSIFALVFTVLAL